MNRSRQILILRLSFWVGAVIDGVVAVQMLLPDFWVNFNGLTAASSGVLNFALFTASVLMWGWTALLIWADRKPIERRGILLLTAFPVVFGLALNNALAACSGLRTVQSTLPTLALQCVLAGLFVFSYFNSRRATT
ncbi:MAG: hypothetical protein NWF01_01365 [Candidatus Bathyarchaeota archaeon]|nr:hypothetical protein [Candidatus Bathyarchaeota archaeon]